MIPGAKSQGIYACMRSPDLENCESAKRGTIRGITKYVVRKKPGQGVEYRKVHSKWIVKNLKT